jgi:hypothetical protein
MRQILDLIRSRLHLSVRDEPENDHADPRYGLSVSYTPCPACGTPEDSAQ